MKSCDSKKKDMAIRMSKKGFMKEHKDLLKVLKSGKGMKKEAREQSKELKKYQK